MSKNAISAENDLEDFVSGMEANRKRAIKNLETIFKPLEKKHKMVGHLEKTDPRTIRFIPEGRERMQFATYENRGNLNLTQYKEDQRKNKEAKELLQKARKAKNNIIKL